MTIDNIVIEFVHNLCLRFGDVVTPIMRIVSILGEKCIFCLLIALFLCLKKKTRWIGLTAIIAIFLGFVLADGILKPLIMRERPYLANNTFYDYWQLAGAYQETNYSMPSGHSIGIAAFFVSLYITSPKEHRGIIKNIGVIATILMVLSRCYFMHHYFSDCVVGVIIGSIMAYVAKAIVKMIHIFCKKNEDLTLFNTIINFDLFDRGNKIND